MYDTFIQFLHHLLGEPLSKEAQAEIDTNFQSIFLPKNSKLLDQGQICKHCFYIHKGCCRFYHIRNQHEYTHWFSFEQEIATSLSSFTSQNPALNLLSYWKIVICFLLNMSDLTTFTITTMNGNESVGLC